VGIKDASRFLRNSNDGDHLPRAEHPVIDLGLRPHQPQIIFGGLAATPRRVTIAVEARLSGYPRNRVADQRLVGVRIKRPHRQRKFGQIENEMRLPRHEAREVFGGRGIYRRQRRLGENVGRVRRRDAESNILFVPQFNVIRSDE
jgi:hypothetical protein